MFDFLKKKKKPSEVETYIGDLPEEKKSETPTSLPPGADEESENGDSYYKKGAFVFKISEYISIALLVFIMVGVLTVYPDVFTKENFRYLMKNLDINSSKVSDSFETVYLHDINCRFSEFRGDLAIVSNGVFEIVDYRGNLSLSSENSAENPALYTSSKYLLVSDIGDKDYYIYNSFSSCCAKKMNNNILVCDMSECGMYVIVTESIEYAAEVFVYDENFNLISEIKRNDTVTAVKLSDDGKYLSLGTLGVDKNGELLSGVCLYNISSGQIDYSVKLYEESPLALSFAASEDENADNSEPLIVALGSKTLMKIKNGEITASYKLLGSDISYFVMDGERFVYTVGKSELYDNSDIISVDFTDFTSENICETKEKIKKIKIKDNRLYVLLSESVIMADGEKNIYTYSSGAVDDIIPYSEYGVFIVSSGKAELIHFGSDE